MARPVVLSLVLSAACSVAVPASPSDYPTPPGSMTPAQAIAQLDPPASGTDWVVRCPERDVDCTAAAARRCPSGYLVLDDEARPIAAVLSGAPPAVTGSQLRGRCVAGVIGEDPSVRAR